MRALIVSIAALVAAGCSTSPPAPAEPETTPAHPTAVIETHVTTNGLKGLFPLDMNERRYVRPNMSREENTIRGTGAFSGFLMNVFGPNQDAVIDRLDRKLSWTLDLSKQEYTECPLKGCSAAQAAPAAQKEQEQPEAKREPGCVMHVAKRSFTVTPTGEKRNINGFEATEYRVAWIATLKDKAGRSSTSSLKIETWTTPLTANMREALHFEQLYARAYARSVHARGKAGPRDLSEPLPPEVSKAMLGYIGELSARDRTALLAVDKQLQRIKGHPIRSRIDWDFEGNACAASESSGTQAESSKSVFSGLANIFSSKKDGDQKSAGEPLLSLTYEIKSLKMEGVHDGQFLVPAGYRRTNP